MQNVFSILGGTRCDEINGSCKKECYKTLRNKPNGAKASLMQNVTLSFQLRV